VLASRDSKVLLESTVIESLWHPCLDVLMELASENPALFALLLVIEREPAALEWVGTNASRVEWHLDTVYGSVDGVDLGRREAETGGVDLVQVGEYLEEKLVGQSL
jgi:hypothetical protein